MSKLDVMYQFDNNYAPFAGVSMTTLFKNNQNIDELTVYVAAKDIAEEHRKKFAELSRQYHRDIVYLNVDHIYRQLEEIGVKSWNGSLAIWMKMFVIDSVPDSVDQLLYIDSDTLISDSLEELSQLDLGNYPVGAVIDSISRKSNARLNLGEFPYYNSGVMYLNVKYWRKHLIQTKMIEHLKKNAERYPIPDQDLLNDFFRGQILRLQPKYNFQGTHFFYKDDVYFPGLKWEKGMYYTPTEIAQARAKPCIIHFFRFCGEYPWQPGNIHGCKALYESALDDSLWKGFRYPVKPLKLVFRVERVLYRVLPQKLFLWIFLKI